MTDDNEPFYWGASTAADQVGGSGENDWTRWEDDVAEDFANEAEARFEYALPDRAHDPDTYRSEGTVNQYEPTRKTSIWRQN